VREKKRLTVGTASNSVERRKGGLVVHGKKDGASVRLTVYGFPHVEGGSRPGLKVKRRTSKKRNLCLHDLIYGGEGSEAWRKGGEV